MTSGIHKQWKLARLKKELRSRLDHVDYGSSTLMDDQLADYLAERGDWTDASKNRWVPCTDVALLGLLYQRQGAFTVLDGDPAGWQRLALGTQYTLRAAQFNIVRCDREFARTKNETCSLWTYGDLLPQILSLGWLDEARRFGPWLIQAVLHGYCFDTKQPFRNCARWFYLKLYADFTKSPELDWPAHATTAPEYEALLAHWRTPDPAALAPRLLAACDRHTHECFGRSSAENKQQDFQRDTTHGWPIEIHMVFRLRAALGLPNPTLDHPLMQTGLAHVPDATPAQSDELLDALTAKVCDIYPELRERL